MFTPNLRSETFGRKMFIFKRKDLYLYLLVRGRIPGWITQTVKLGSSGRVTACRHELGPIVTACNDSDTA